MEEIDMTLQYVVSTYVSLHNICIICGDDLDMKHAKEAKKN